MRRVNIYVNTNEKYILELKIQGNLPHRRDLLIVG